MNIQEKIQLYWQLQSFCSAYSAIKNRCLINNTNIEVHIDSNDNNKFTLTITSKDQKILYYDSIVVTKKELEFIQNWINNDNGLPSYFKYNNLYLQKKEYLDTFFKIMERSEQKNEKNDIHIRHSKHKNELITSIINKKKLLYKDTIVLSNKEALDIISEITNTFISNYEINLSYITKDHYSSTPFHYIHRIQNGLFDLFVHCNNDEELSNAYKFHEIAMDKIISKQYTFYNN